MDKTKQSEDIFKKVKEKFLGQQPAEHPKTDATLEELSDLLNDREEYRW